MAADYYRKCNVVKEETEEYEFFLRVDNERNGNIIVSVSPGGPADRAGLKNGDRIIEIDGTNAEKKSHTEVVQLIKKSKNEIMFQVVDQENDPNNPKSKKNGSVKTSVSEKKPRLCHIVKENNSLGFSIEAQGSDKTGHFICSVAGNGPAMKVGVREGDRIIEVGGKNVEKMNHAKVVELIKKKGNKVTLLVADKETYKQFQKRKIKIKAKHALVSSEGGKRASAKSEKSSKTASKKNAPKATSLLPASQDEKARLVHVIKASGKGYGFFLRVKKGEKGEYIGDLRAGAAGDKCGLMENDRILSANGKGILTKTHDEVVEIIKSNSNHVVLLVAGPNAIKNAKNNGLLSVLSDAKEHIIEKPRNVKLTKGTDGYGFSLKMDMKNKKGHVFSDIAENTPASKEGLKDGDVLGCINGKDVTKLEHEETVEKIKNAGGNVELLVGSAATMDLLRDLDVDITEEFLNSWPSSDILRIPDLSDADDFFKIVAAAAVVSAVAETVAEVRKDTITCTLTKVDQAFGFFLRDENGHFLGNIEKDGAADRAGVKDNDQIIEVNGVNVEKETHDKVVQMIKESGEKVVFAVWRKEQKEDERPATKTDVIDPEHQEEAAPPRPRFCELERLPNGYGFNLNAEDGDRPGQYMKKIVAKGAASIAGVREGDRVIEINDINISEKTHDDVVSMIKNSGTRFTMLVVDEEADLYYKKKKIEITKALATGEEAISFFERRNPEDDSLVYKGVLEEMAILSTALDVRSSTSSIVETEATVHVEPEDVPDKSSPPVFEAPPPPSYDEEEKEEEVSELIEEAISEIREDREAELKEIAEEIKQTAAVEIIVDEFKEDLEEEIREDIQEEIAEIVEDVKEEMKEEIKEELMDDIKEEILEEVKEEIIEEMKEEAKEEALEEIREELIEDVKENIADGVKTAIVLAAVDEIKDAMEENKEKEIKQKIVEEIRETPEEMKLRIEKELREQMEREIKEKMEEEMRQKLAATAAPPPPPPPELPQTPAAVSVSAIASSFGREIRPKSSIKKPTPSAAPALEDLNNAARNLRSVKKLNEIRNEAKEEENEEESASKSLVNSARAMFEAGGSQKRSGPTPSWKKASNTSVKAAGAYGAPKTTPIVNGTEKPVTGRQTNWKKGGMSLKIVETSSTFN